MEPLEARAMLAGDAGALAATVNGTASRTATESYVSWIGGALVDRPMSEATRSKLVRLIDGGWSRERAAAYVIRSAPGRRAEIESVYERLLKRDPTEREIRWYLNETKRGADQLLVIRDVVKSREYFQSRAGGTDAGFVLAMSGDLLGRAPTEAESARLLAALEHGASRGRLTTTVLRSPEYVEAASRQLAKRVAGGAGDSKLIRDLVSAWRGPQSLTRAKARLFGSESFLTALLNPPPRTTPPPTGAPDVQDPLTPQFNLGTEWDALNIPFFNLESIGASPTGTFWFGSTAGGLTAYDVVARTSKSIWSGVAVSVAPISDTTAWVVGSDQSPVTAPYVAKVVQGGLPALTSSLPNADVPSQIAAAPDGTVWVLAQSGTVYSYAAATDSWSQIPSNGFTIEKISMGSASNVWAIGRSQGSQVLLNWSSSGGWAVDAFFNGASPSVVSAAADGSVFVGVSFAGQRVFLKPPGGTWAQVPNQTPPGTLYFIAAADRNRMLALTPDVYVLSVGLVDRPAVAFPEVTSQWKAAYDAITKELGIVNPLGIRGLYGDGVVSTLQNWQQQLQNQQLALPLNSGILPSNWDAVQAQLGAELKNVLAVNSLFDNLNKINTAVNTVNTASLSNAATRVALSNQEQSTNPIALAIEAMFEAAVAGVATLFTGAGATIAAVVGSAIDNAVADLTGQSNPNDATTLTETYLKLSTDLGNLFVTTGSTYTAQWNKIVGTQTTLGDYGMLTALGSVLNSGLWYVPDGEAQTVAAAAKPAFETYFYQALVPSKWQIVYALQVICDLYNCPDFQAPSYDQYVVLISGGGNDSLVNYYYSNQIGAGTDPYRYGGPYPSSDLLDYLWSIGVSQADFFTNADGNWDLKYVAATY